MKRTVSEMGSATSEDTADTMADMNFLLSYDESPEKPDEPKDILTLVDMQRVVLQSHNPPLGQLKGIGKLLSLLLEDEETLATATTFDKILYTRLDELIDGILKWKIRNDNRAQYFTRNQHEVFRIFDTNLVSGTW